jgi:predicted P-loop ATPase
VVKFPRQNSFAGSVNDSQYLIDATGGRRFWPVLAPRIDLKALERDRDQLFAEALIHFSNKKPWYLDTPDLVKLAKIEQDARYQADAWESLIVDYLRREAKQTVTTADVFESALGVGDKSKWNLSDQRRIGACLRRLKWTRKHVRIGHDFEWRFVRPGYEPGE